MNYKILCSDLDGTLLSTKSDVSETTIAQIARIKERLRVILASARMPRAMTYLQDRLGIGEQPIICYNGALVLHGEKRIFSETIDFRAVEEVYRLAGELDIELGLYCHDEWYVEKTSERVRKEIAYTRTQPVYRPTGETLSDWESRNSSAHKIMLMGTKQSADIVFSGLTGHLSGKVNIYRSNDTLIELAPKSVSKLSAVRSLLSANESMAHVIAFGDNYNDMEMLEHSGLGIAVGNAREAVKAIADHTTLNNTEHGVAHFIEHHLI